jgi:hypothetical protein
MASVVITDELQSSIYSALCGFYRASIGDLRLAIEGAIASLYFTVFSDREQLQAWEKGDFELRMNDARQRLAHRDPCDRFPGLMDDGQWVAESLRQLNSFSHGKPSTANIELWEGSNGPIYVPRSFMLWRNAFVDILLLIVVLTALAEPRLVGATYPEDFSLSNFINGIIAWHREPPGAATDILHALVP